MNKLIFFLILLLFLLGASDLYFALQNKELEANPGLIVMRERFGLGWSWGIIIFFKTLLLVLAASLLLSKSYATERRFFFVLSLVSLLMVTQAYGTYTGIRGAQSVAEIEENQGYPLTQVQKVRIQEDTSSVSLPKYNQSVFFLSVLPLLVANMTFWIFDRLKKGVSIGK